MQKKKAKKKSKKKQKKHKKQKKIEKQKKTNQIRFKIGKISTTITLVIIAMSAE